MPSCIFLAFANVIRTQYLIPNKKDKVYILSVWIGAIVNLVLNALLIPKYGSVGAAIGTLCAEGAVCIVQAIGTRKEIHTWQLFISSSHFLVFGMVMCLMVKLIPSSLFNMNNFYKLIIKVLFGALVYSLCVTIKYRNEIIKTIPRLTKHYKLNTNKV